MNGGCYFRRSIESCEMMEEVNVLGRYVVEGERVVDLIEDLNEKAAILEIFAGKGKVLLSGVHFEYDAEKLELSNENIASNVYAKLKSNESSLSTTTNDEARHSNHNLVGWLLRKVFALE